MRITNIYIAQGKPSDQKHELDIIESKIVQKLGKHRRCVQPVFGKYTFEKLHFGEIHFGKIHFGEINFGKIHTVPVVSCKHLA